MIRLLVFSLLFGLLLPPAAIAQDSAIGPNVRAGRLLRKSDTLRLKKYVFRQKPSGFGLSHLRSIENMGIYEGKKSEVIVPDQLQANLATNNARQVFSGVAGLNVIENDAAGLQLGIGGRGLDPNRTSSFNVRQNGCDISADALGYPESYYTPPMEAVGKIQIVRGAASLQYGTQFGGLLNFQMKTPVRDRALELQFRQSAGSFGFYNAFTSLSGTAGKLSYYGYFQYKRMDGWRQNSELESISSFLSLHYRISSASSLSFEYTYMQYLAHQAGGLSDAMFLADPRQSKRQRNWFEVGWNLPALQFQHIFKDKSEFNLRLFGLLAHRYAIGFRPNRVAVEDNMSERDLIRGAFRNAGAEARYLKRYTLKNTSMALLAGVRLYRGYNHSIQGLGSKGSDADFRFIQTGNAIANDFTFPNRNLAVFAENIVYIGKKLSLTPGLRLEHIQTRSEGYYNSVQFDLAGNIISSQSTPESRQSTRRFLLGGIGFSYKPGLRTEFYSNLSQNYRSITFSDMRISNPSQVIDPDLQDEKGYSFDLGIRSRNSTWFNGDFSVFILHYNNRIGEVQTYDAGNRVLRLRTNIGRAVISGIESYAEADLLQKFHPQSKKSQATVFVNLALMHSGYRSGLRPGMEGNRVEYVPAVNAKSGFRLGRNRLRFSFQAAYLSEQYTDASNATDGGVSAVVGLIPSYFVMDAGFSYQHKRFKAELNSNNLGNRMYFTRRASGYPGPGIIPSDGRSFYLSLSYTL